MKVRRFRWAFLAACLPVLLVVGCGDDSPGPASFRSTTSTAIPTTPTSATSGAAVTEVASTTPGNADCAHGAPLATVSLGGGSVGFVETTDHRYLCVDTGTGHFFPLGLDPNPPAVAEPQFAGFGAVMPGGALYRFLLPDRPAEPVIVRDEAGMTVIYILSTDGRQLVVFEPHSAAEAALPQPFGRTWTIVSPAGAVLETLRTPAPPSQGGSAETAASTSPPSVDTSTTPTPSSASTGSGYSDHETPLCLFEHGLSAEDPQPYSPEVAVPAWQACRDLLAHGMETAGMPADKIAEAMAFYDCMAAQGWIWIQPAAYEASAKCGRG